MKNLKKQILLSVAFATLLCASKISVSLPYESMKEFGGIWAAIEKFYDAYTDVQDIYLQRIRQIVAGQNFDINQRFEYKPGHFVTPLLFACHGSRQEDLSAELVRFLLENGAEKSVNILDELGNSPISSILNPCRPNFEIIKLLLEYGAKDERAIQDFIKKIKSSKDLTEQGWYRLLLAVQKFYKSTDKTKVIDKYKNNQEIYDLLNKIWQRSLRGKNPFLTKGGQRVLQEGLKSDTRIHFQD